jgi:hypothetical protein
MRVLFVGNSYTFCNDMPGIVTRLAAAGEAPPFVPEQVTAGGRTLQGHWEAGTAQARIGDEGGWDAVVLQEQSLRPVEDRAAMHDYARRFHREIARTGARTVFYLTWARQHLPEQQAGLNAAYGDMARELGATVAPAGVAWQRALAERPYLTLHEADRSHPTPLGSYLAACVFYATLYGRSPEGLDVHGVDAGHGDPARATSVILTAADVAFLQRVAWQTVRDAV